VKPIRLYGRRRWAPVLAASRTVSASAGCTATRSRLEPYRSDALQAHALEQRAAEECQQQRGPTVVPPHPFTTDGCSLWPDGAWVDCCVEHDIAYWCGGPAVTREHADLALRDCVSHGASCVSSLMYVGVRAGGAPWRPFAFRWAYGWDWPHGYDDPSAAVPSAPSAGK
jgi:hypothetical protein